MDTLILIITATCIFLPYIIYQNTKKKKGKGSNIKMLRQVEAGPTKRWLNRKIDLTPMVPVDMEDIDINPKLEYFVVKNRCMQIRGISEGDIVGVRMCDNACLPETTGNEPPILLIYLDDKNFKGFKIREQGDITCDGTAYNTYHYEGGIKHRSSKPHAISSIKGVVVEVHQRRYLASVN